MKQPLTSDSLLRILVIDDHESVLNGTVDILQKNYPKAEFITAINTNHALEQINSFKPGLVVMDLSIPETIGQSAKPDTGIRFLKTLMNHNPDLNIVVQSVHIKTLVRIRPEIDNYKGGFTVVDKSISIQEMLTRVDWALQGLTHTKDIKGIYSGLEIKPEWLKVLTLAFCEGFQDKIIAEKMCVSERMVRHYWSKIQDALQVYPEEGKNMRIQTEMRAREQGLID
ncbi:MAG TPA: response regulator transcription factor [Nostocaceae cyanobacterium]|nr:response regulator transcription factor [Nostocaceae cyanobacterium]